MHNISIPDPLYAEAKSAATAAGMSVERFVRDAVRLHLGDEREQLQRLTLTDDQIARVRQAQVEVKAGMVLTMEQVEQRHAASRFAWLKENEL